MKLTTRTFSIPFLVFLTRTYLGMSCASLRSKIWEGNRTCTASKSNAKTTQLSRLSRSVLNGCLTFYRETKTICPMMWPSAARRSSPRTQDCSFELAVRSRLTFLQWCLNKLSVGLTMHHQAKLSANCTQKTDNRDRSSWKTMKGSKRKN